MSTRAATREELESLMRGGMDDHQMAERLGMKVDSLRRLRLRRGLPRGVTGIDRSSKTPEQLREIESYLDEGYSFRAIVGMAGISHTTLAKKFPGRAFTAKQASEAAVMARKLEEL